MKLEALKIESNSPKLARGETIVNSIIITILPDKFSVDLKKELSMLSVSASPKINPVIIKLKHEMPKKNIKTFLAKDSRRV